MDACGSLCRVIAFFVFVDKCVAWRMQANGMPLECMLQTPEHWKIWFHSHCDMDTQLRAPPTMHVRGNRACSSVQILRKERGGTIDSPHAGSRVSDRHDGQHRSPEHEVAKLQRRQPTVSVSHCGNGQEACTPAVSRHVEENAVAGLPAGAVLPSMCSEPRDGGACSMACRTWSPQTGHGTPHPACSGDRKALVLLAAPLMRRA